MPEQKAKEVFFHAIEFDGELNAFLDEQCGDDQDLRCEVEELISAHQKAGGFLGGSASVGATKSITSPLVEQPGSKIGPFKLLQKIGEGGFGVVYLAEQTEPVRRKVALKIIKPGMDTKEVIARFEAERQALAMMDHPNIAKVLDGGTTDSGRPFFVMELVKGIPLTEFCDTNRLDTNDRLQLFASVCKAIQHAHNKGVIHRDIKPSNVMVTLHDGDPVPKVIDFGVAKAITSPLTEKTMFTAYGQMIGTPQYMSPEQAEMSGLDIDTRSDVYSLGVLLYELLTGTTPLTPESMRGRAYAEMQKMIREDEPPKPSIRLSSLGDASGSIAANRNSEIGKLGSIVRGELDWIVMKSLEKKRERRYETANSLAADVERYLNHEAVEACPPSFVYLIEKLARRHRAALSIAASFILLVGLSSAVAWGLLIDARRARRAAVDFSEELEHERDAAIDARKLAEAARELAETHQRRAENEKQRVVAAESRIQQQAYEHGVLLAGQAFEKNDLSRARQLLDLCPVDYRAWEWDWMSREVDNRFQAMEVPENDRVIMNTFGFSHDGKETVRLKRDATPNRLVLTNTATDEVIWETEVGPDKGTSWSPHFVDDAGRFIRVEHIDYSGVDLGSLSTAEQEQVAKERYRATLLDAATGKILFATRDAKRLLLDKDENECWLLEREPDGLRAENWALDGNAAELNRTIKLKMPNERIARQLTTVRQDLDPNSKEILTPNCQRLFIANQQDSQLIVLRGWDTQRGGSIWDRPIEAFENTQSQRRGQKFRFVYDHQRDRLTLLTYRNVPVNGVSDNRPAIAYQIDATNGSVVSEKHCPLADANQHSISDDGRFIASSNAEHAVCVWDPATGTEINRYQDNGMQRFGPRIRSSGLWLSGGRVNVNPKPLQTVFRGHKRRIVSLSFDSTGKNLLSSSADETLRLWRVDDGREIACIPVRSPGIAKFLSDGRIVHKSLTGIHVRSMTNDQAIPIELPFSRELQPLQLSIEKQLVGVNRTFLRKWNLDSGELTSETSLPLPTFRRQSGKGDIISRMTSPLEGEQHCYAVSADGSRAIVLRMRGGILDCNVESGSVREIDAVLSIGTQRCLPLFQPGTNHIVAIAERRTIRLLDLDQQADLVRCYGHSAMVSQMQFSPDGKRLFSVDVDGTLAVWNTRNGEQLFQISDVTEKQRPVIAMAISPDGQTIALADFDEIRLLETKNPSQDLVDRREIVEVSAAYVDQCFEQTRLVSRVLDMIRRDDNLTADVRKEASRIAKVRGNLSLASATLAIENQFDDLLSQFTSESLADHVSARLIQIAEEATWLAANETPQDRDLRFALLGNRLSAASMTNPLVESIRDLKPETVSLARLQAEWAGKRTDWQRVAQSLDVAMELSQPNPPTWFRIAYLRALVFLRLGDLKSYNTICREAQSKSRQGLNLEAQLSLAKMFLLSAKCDADLEPFEQLIADVDHGNIDAALAREHAIVAGMLAYRQGRFSEAMDRLKVFRLDQRTIRNGRLTFPTIRYAKTANFGADVLQFATIRMVLAMTAKQLGDAKNAMQWLEEADAQPWFLLWKDKLTYQLLRDEATELFGHETTVTPTAYGWSMPLREPPYDRPYATRTTNEAHSGRASLLLQWGKRLNPKNHGVIAQSIAASPYVGKRIRLSCHVKSDLFGAGTLWMRVDGSRTKRPFDNMNDRPIRGTTDWQRYSLVLDVPPDATQIVFGGLMKGRGRFWLDDFTLETVGNDVQPTDIDRTEPDLTSADREKMLEAAKHLPDDIVNGGFEQPQRLLGLHLGIVDGVLTVQRVWPNSIGEAAGVQAGNKILSIDETPVESVFGFIDALHAGPRTKRVLFLVDEEEKSITFEFQE